MDDVKDGWLVPWLRDGNALSEEELRDICCSCLLGLNDLGAVHLFNGVMMAEWSERVVFETGESGRLRCRRSQNGGVWNDEVSEEE